MIPTRWLMALVVVAAIVGVGLGVWLFGVTA